MWRKWKWSFLQLGFEEQSVSMDMKTLPIKHFHNLPADVPVSIAAIAASLVSTTAAPGASSKTLTDLEDAPSTEVDINVTKL